MKSIIKKVPLDKIKTVFFSVLFVSFFSLFVSCTIDDSNELIYNSIMEDVEVSVDEVENDPKKGGVIKP